MWCAISAQRAYRLGYKVLTLSRALLSGNEKTELVAACLREISARTGEAAHYSVLERDCAVLVQRAMGTQLVTIDFQIGDRAPLHCTSIGKVLLAYQDSVAIETAILLGLPRHARNTITTPTRLRAELRKVRAQRYAYDDMEFADDMRCVAVPVIEKDGHVTSGISLSGPASRYSQAKVARVARLRDGRSARAILEPRRYGSRWRRDSELEEAPQPLLMRPAVMNS